MDFLQHSTNFFVIRLCVYITLINCQLACHFSENPASDSDHRSNTPTTDPQKTHEQLQLELSELYDTSLISGFYLKYTLDTNQIIHIHWGDSSFNRSIQDEMYPGWAPSEFVHESSNHLAIEHSCGSACWSVQFLPKGPDGSTYTRDYPLLYHPEKDLFVYWEYHDSNIIAVENIGSRVLRRFTLTDFPDFGFFMDGIDTCYFENDNLVITYKTEVSFNDNAPTKTQRLSMFPLYAEWEQNSDYVLMGIPPIKPDDDYVDSLIQVKIMPKTFGNKVTKFKVNFSSNCENVTLETLTDPGIMNVSEVIRIQFDFQTCCSDLYNYYFLVSYQGTLTRLPVIHNVWCDDPSTHKAYVFPNERFGIKNQISLMEITPESSGDLVKKARFINALDF